MQGAIYVRVSTDDQTEYSPDSQIKLCLKYANEHDIKVNPDYIFKEDGISGTNVEKREQFKKMIGIAKRKPKPFDCILIYSFSRFARNREDSIMYKSLLRKKLGIEVISITQPLTDGKESILMEALYEAMDEYYSVDLAEQSIRGKLEKASRGEHQGAEPYGYTYDKNKRQLYPNEEAKNVEFIYKEFLVNPNYKQLVIKLNSLDIKTKKGAPWSSRTIKRLLQNPVYNGYACFKKGGFNNDFTDKDIIKVKGKWKPIIDDELWNKVQKVLNNKRNQWFKYKKEYVKHEFYMRGIIKCSDCGGTMIHVHRDKYDNYFQCTNYTHRQCTSHHISEAKIMKAILNQVQKDYALDLHLNYSNKLDYTNDIELYSNEKNKLENKLKRIKEAYLNGIDTLEEYKTNKTKILNQLETIDKELKSLNIKEYEAKKEAEIKSQCKKVYEVLTDNKISDKIKSEVAHSLFEKIVYYKKEDKIVIFYR